MDPAKYFIERFATASSSSSSNVVLKKESASSYCLKKSKATGESGVLLFKQNSINLSPAEASDRKKKCFSDQSASAAGDHSYSKTNYFNLSDLPLLPLSCICAKLNLIDRQTLSRVCTKLANADQTAWLSRRSLNVKSDLAFYVFHRKNANTNTVFDDYFDFVSLSLLFRKLQLITPHFVGNRLNTIDFSQPLGSFEMRKFGCIFLLNFEYFNLRPLIMPTKVLELNFRHTMVTVEDLEVCSLLFPKLTSIVLSLRTVIWRENMLEPLSLAAVEHHVTTGDSKHLVDHSKTRQLMAFLHAIFPRLKRITLYYF